MHSGFSESQRKVLKSIESCPLLHLRWTTVVTQRQKWHLVGVVMWPLYWTPVRVSQEVDKDSITSRLMHPIDKCKRGSWGFCVPGYLALWSNGYCDCLAAWRCSGALCLRHINIDFKSDMWQNSQMDTKKIKIENKEKDFNHIVKSSMKKIKQNGIYSFHDWMCNIFLDMDHVSTVTAELVCFHLRVPAESFGLSLWANSVWEEKSAAGRLCHGFQCFEPQLESFVCHAGDLFVALW